MRRFCVHLLATFSMVVLTGSMAAAQSQTQSQAQSPIEEIAPIVVTGSRIIQNGNSSPTPLTVIGAAQLMDSAPTGIAVALSQIPEFIGNPTPSTALSPIAPTGTYLDLRGLGESRTLVLLDGRRVAPTDLGGQVDINTFPQLLLKRVDIVTGGASAAYGTDAVAGVVNYVLDTDMVGIKASVSGGISSRDDDQEQRASIAGGTAFADGRGHLLASVDYTNSQGILNDSNRAWDNQGWDVIQNPTYPGSGTAYLLRPGVTGSQLANGGVIISGPLKGTQFLANGVPAPFNYGSLLTNNTMVGGSGEFSQRGNIADPYDQLGTYVHGSYQFSDQLNIFGEVGYGNSHTYYPGTTPNFSGSTAFTIYNDNAYLPASIRNEMASAGITSFQLGRLSNDWGRPTDVNNAEYYREAVGAEYNVAGWTFEGTVDSGHTIYETDGPHTVNQPNLFNAADAVISPTSGQPVCRSTLTNPGNGCVPLDLFGPNVASQAALNYITGTLNSVAHLSQTAVALSARGTAFSTWAGPVQAGGGFDYRVVNAEETADPGSTALIEAAPGSQGLPAALVGKIGVWFTGNQSPVVPVSETIKEAYVEFLAPLASDMRFAKSLDLNAALRFADYSISGSVISSKVGLVYKPVSDVTLRATLSRDTRAPTLNELYGPVVSVNAPVVDPLTHTAGNAVVYSGGNPDLRPEIGNTTTVGIVYSPSWLPGFSGSIDWHNITINNAIGALSAAQILTLCTSGNTTYCAYVDRLPNNALVSVSTQNLNLNSVNTTGVDTELNYAADLSGIHLPGNIVARTLFSFLNNLSTTDPFGNVIDSAGDVGLQGDPKWQMQSSLTYNLRAFSVLFQERFISAGNYSNSSFTTGGTASTSLDYNHVPAVWYSDLTLKYNIEVSRGHCQLFLTVNNLFDQDPPVAPNRQGSPISIIATNATLYDVVGRYFTAGLRASF
jgi:iron complex outermembrane receptor protein